MTRRIRLLQALSTCAFGVGILIALPGAFLILAAGWFMDLAVDQEIATREHSLDSEVQ